MSFTQKGIGLTVGDPSREKAKAEQSIRKARRNRRKSAETIVVMKAL